MNSILDTRRGECFLCGKQGQTELHHIFPGANRDLSTQYGLTVYLCHSCHNEPPNGAHINYWTRRALQRTAQLEAMKRYGWTETDFTKIFGRNYL